MFGRRAKLQCPRLIKGLIGQGSTGWLKRFVGTFLPDDVLNLDRANFYTCGARPVGDSSCFNEQAGITFFIERVLAQPEVSHLLLIDDGSTDSTVS